MLLHQQKLQTEMSKNIHILHATYILKTQLLLYQPHLCCCHVSSYEIYKI